jgi:hypothetical protein
MPVRRDALMRQLARCGQHDLVFAPASMRDLDGALAAADQVFVKRLLIGPNAAFD